MNIGDSHELKSLQGRRAKLQAEVVTALADVKEANKKMSLAQSALDQLDAKIIKLTAARKVPVVSEHALLRYMERVMGFDLEKIRADILTPKNVLTIGAVITGKIPIVDGYKLVVKDGTIVTIE